MVKKKIALIIIVAVVVIALVTLFFVYKNASTSESEDITGNAIAGKKVKTTVVEGERTASDYNEQNAMVVSNALMSYSL